MNLKPETRREEFLHTIAKAVAGKMEAKPGKRWESVVENVLLARIGL